MKGCTLRTAAQHFAKGAIDMSTQRNLQGWRSWPACGVAIVWASDYAQPNNAAVTANQEFIDSIKKVTLAKVREDAETESFADQSRL